MGLQQDYAEKQNGDSRNEQFKYITEEEKENCLYS